MQPDAISTIPETQEETEEIVSGVARDCGVSVTRAIQLVADRLRTLEESSGAVLACSRGCSRCCYQMVSVMPGEWKEITKHLVHTPGLLKTLRSSARELILQFRDYLKESFLRARHPVALAQDWDGEPCVFLNVEDGSCRVYPVRPIVCRVITGTVPCSSLMQTRRWRWKWEEWLDRMTNYEEMRLAGGDDPRKLGATPLPVLLDLLIKRHKRW